MRRTLLGVLLVAFLAAACGGGARHSSGAPTTSPVTAHLGSGTPTSTTTTVPDPAVIPPVITPAYVNAVLAQLNHVYGDAVRLAVSTDNIPRPVVTDLRAIYADPQYTDELQAFTQSLLTQLQQVRLNPGDRLLTVSDLTSAGPTCVQAEVSADYRNVDKTPAPPAMSWITLRPKTQTNDPNDLNPTTWTIAYEMAQAPTGNDAC